MPAEKERKGVSEEVGDRGNLDPIFDIAIGAAIEQKSLGLCISQKSGEHVAISYKKMAK
jgi:hypothetical protein